jgi:hypothetical protein
LILNSAPLLVLGAICAPLMAPVVGLSLGTVIGSFKFFVLNLIGLFLGCILVFVVGLLVGYFSGAWMEWDLEQAYFHAQLSWENFLLLFVGAIFTSALLVRRERSAAAPSVALAYTLYLPLVVAGFGFGSGTEFLWPDGLVVFTVHLAWAALAGAITLAIMGFRPLTLFGYTLGGAVALLCVILLIGFSGISAVLGAFGQPLAVPTQVPTSTLTLTPVPPTPTLTLTPVPPTLTLTPTYTSTPSVTPSLTPTLTPTPLYARIDAPGESGGANLRVEPGFGGRTITSLLNGTLVIILPDLADVDGRIWAHVIVVADGREGWVMQDLLLVPTPAPNW